jgi:nuclear pore complex protein Nup98-Nup96
VYCYADGEKPPLGQGLNCEAEITLLNVYKVGHLQLLTFNLAGVLMAALLPCLQQDKSTGAPTRDPAELLRWEKRLRAMCARMGTKFISYKAEGGVWKFEVRMKE